jgi:hypothetical protein
MEQRRAPKPLPIPSTAISTSSTSLNACKHLQDKSFQHYHSSCDHTVEMKERQKARSFTKKSTLSASPLSPSQTPLHRGSKKAQSIPWWFILSRCLTFCCCDCALSKCLNKKDSQSKQAWREKVNVSSLSLSYTLLLTDSSLQIALCFIILVLSALFTFVVVGLKPLWCEMGLQANNIPPPSTLFDQQTHSNIVYSNDVRVHGFLYDFNDMAVFLQSNYSINLTSDWYGQDISRLFLLKTSLSIYTCDILLGSPTFSCSVPNMQFPRSPPLSPPLPNNSSQSIKCPDVALLSLYLRAKARATFAWNEVTLNTKPPHALIVYSGVILNLTSYITYPPTLEISVLTTSLGKDATRTLESSQDFRNIRTCLLNRAVVGYLPDTGVAFGCIGTASIEYLCLVIVAIVIVIRLGMAVLYHLAVAPFHTWRVCRKGRGMEHKAADDLNIIYMVTCYSESRGSLKKTLDSIAGNYISKFKSYLTHIY